MSDGANPLVRHDEDRWPDAGPAWKQTLRAVFDATTRGLARVNVPGALAMLDTMGRAANMATVLGPSASDVGMLFDWLSPDARAGTARSIAALHLKNRAAIALVQGGRTDALASLVRWADDDRRAALLGGTRGTLIVACHVGAFFGIRAALHHTARPVFMMRDVTMPDAASRASALKRAVDSLRAGELVVATLDGPGGTSTQDVACLGRRIVLRRGPFTLARLTGSPIVPIVCAWTRRHSIEIRVAPTIERPEGENLGPADVEDDMAARTAQWLDAYLRACPEEIWPSTLRNYLSAPRVDGP